MKLSEEEKKRVIDEFDALARCKHIPSFKAYECSRCRKEKWQDTETISGKTIGQLIDTFIELGKIDRIELEQHIKQGVIKKKRVKKILFFLLSLLFYSLFWFCWSAFRAFAAFFVFSEQSA